MIEFILSGSLESSAVAIENNYVTWESIKQRLPRSGEKSAMQKHKLGYSKLRGGSHS